MHLSTLREGSPCRKQNTGGFWETPLRLLWASSAQWHLQSHIQGKGSIPQCVRRVQDQALPSCITLTLSRSTEISCPSFMRVPSPPTQEALSPTLLPRTGPALNNSCLPFYFIPATLFSPMPNQSRAELPVSSSTHPTMRRSPLPTPPGGDHHP